MTRTRDVSGAHLETGGSETGSLLVLERLLLPQVLVVRPLLLLQRLLLRLRSRHLGPAAPFPVCLLKLFVIPALWAGFRATAYNIQLHSLRVGSARLRHWCE